ncbi:hypothetical protein GOP47_0022547 [Adiantum capillus-veneris]|uniref:Uncharacterized protein n=1 Tax=Adiantum capillus-veneris TaxID=13818 RepID=A0A9D4U5S2_ADICA|nr:hypothetical protein GOP47_0022547 [Adiantum capillus-veneris]
MRALSRGERGRGALGKGRRRLFPFSLNPYCSGLLNNKDTGEHLSVPSFLVLVIRQSVFAVAASSRFTPQHLLLDRVFNFYQNVWSLHLRKG